MSMSTRRVRGAATIEVPAVSWTRSSRPKRRRTYSSSQITSGNSESRERPSCVRPMTPEPPRFASVTSGQRAPEPVVRPHEKRRSVIVDDGCWCARLDPMAHLPRDGTKRVGRRDDVGIDVEPREGRHASVAGVERSRLPAGRELLADIGEPARPGPVRFGGGHCPRRRELVRRATGRRRARRRRPAE